MSFGYPEPTFEAAVQELAIVEASSDIHAEVSDRIASRRLSTLMRSLNLLLEHEEYRPRARNAISRIGFVCD